jgi:hypothetical protein
MRIRARLRNCDITLKRNISLIDDTYHIMILDYFTVGSTSSGSAFVIAPNLGSKTIFESILL